MTSGSRSVVTSPSSLPSAMSRNSRRMILPERVFGRSSAQMIRFGRASLPIRLATCSRSSWIVSYHHVAEAAVIGQADEDSGQAVTAFVTLEGDGEGSDELVGEIREHVAKRIGKLARPKRIIWADDLPKTRSGKIMRRLLRDIAEGRELGDVTTLRDPAVTEMIQDHMKGGETEG